MNQELPPEEPDPVAAARRQLGAARTDVTVIAEAAGDWIGRYHLLEEIGQGGMGSVWTAEQLEPVRREEAKDIVLSVLTGVRPWVAAGLDTQLLEATLLLSRALFRAGELEEALATLESVLAGVDDLPEGVRRMFEAKADEVIQQLDEEN